MERYNDDRLMDEKSLADLAKAYSSMYPHLYENNPRTIRRTRKDNESISNNYNLRSNNSDILQEVTRNFEQNNKQGIVKPSMGVSMPLYHAPNSPNQNNTTRIELLLAEILGELRAIRREINRPNPQPMPNTRPPSPAAQPNPIPPIFPQPRNINSMNSDQ